MNSIIINILIAAFPVILAITLHEAAHGRAALWCGDSTAKMLGRITINPLKHIDLIGTILVPLALFLVSQSSNLNTPIFGWAKPVPVNIQQLRNPLRDQFWVSAAGPAANFLMLLAWWGVFVLFKPDVPMDMTNPLIAIIIQMTIFGIFSNLTLMILNLLPILPLDGGRILMSLLPRHLAWKFSTTERYGFLIILLLLFTHVLDSIFHPIFSWVSHLIFS